MSSSGLPEIQRPGLQRLTPPFSMPKPRIQTEPFRCLIAGVSSYYATSQLPVRHPWTAMNTMAKSSSSQAADSWPSYSCLLCRRRGSCFLCGAIFAEAPLSARSFLRQGTIASIAKQGRSCILCVCNASSLQAEVSSGSSGTQTSDTSIGLLNEHILFLQISVHDAGCASVQVAERATYITRDLPCGE